MEEEEKKPVGRPKQQKTDAQIPVVIDLSSLYAKVSAIESNMDMPMKIMNDHAMAINAQEKRIAQLEAAVFQPTPIPVQGNVETSPPEMPTLPQPADAEMPKRRRLFGK